MKRSDFLSQLRRALEQELDAQAVKENLDYYNEYIQNEMRKGFSEEEVIAGLGDPWAIAKTVLLSSQMGGQEYGSAYTREMPKQQETEMNGMGMIPKWKIALGIAAVVLVLILVLAIVFGVIGVVISLAARFALPILIIVLVIRIFSKKS